jgi:hypothetical protein
MGLKYLQNISYFAITFKYCSGRRGANKGISRQAAPPMTMTQKAILVTGEL